MADVDAGGGGTDSFALHMYEDYRAMVHADDPAAIREVGEWLLGRGRAVAGFADDLTGSLEQLDDAYSSRAGAPALLRRLESTVSETRTVADALLNNGHTLLAAADAIANARQEVDAAGKATDPDGDGVFTLLRTRDPLTDGPTAKARPIMAALNRGLHNLADNIDTLGTYEIEKPPESESGSGPGSSAGPGGASSLPASGTTSRGPSVVPTAGFRPATGQTGMPPVTGGSPPLSSGGTSRGPQGVVGSAPGRSGAPSVAPGAGRGSMLGRLGAPGSAGPGGGGSFVPPGRVIGGPGGHPGAPGAGAPAAPGGQPGGGGPGEGTPPGHRPGHGMPHGVPPGGGRPGGDDGRRGRKKPGYERGELDTFVDGRRGNAAGGEVRRAAERPWKDGGRVLGGQKVKRTEEEAAREWELPPVAATAEPATDGLPDTVRDGAFRAPNGAQFKVRRRGNGG
ncbi:MAG: hypothetical protein ACRDT6_01255 [Micromonosporaceae bacterium]